jgi:hypothetical protein
MMFYVGIISWRRISNLLQKNQEFKQILQRQFYLVSIILIKSLFITLLILKLYILQPKNHQLKIYIECCLGFANTLSWMEGGDNLRPDATRPSKLKTKAFKTAGGSLRVRAAQNFIPASGAVPWQRIGTAHRKPITSGDARQNYGMKIRELYQHGGRNAFFKRDTCPLLTPSIPYIDAARTSRRSPDTQVLKMAAAFLP